MLTVHKMARELAKIPNQNAELVVRIDGSEQKYVVREIEGATVVVVPEKEEKNG